MFMALVTAVDPRLIVVAALTRFIVAAVVVRSPPLTARSPEAVILVSKVIPPDPALKAKEVAPVVFPTDIV